VVQLAEEGIRWRTESPELIVLDLLAKRQGTLKEEELVEMLRAMMRDISMLEINKLLMNLELRGKITVSQIKKGRVISLLQPK
jgi:Fe2+ or Zn2+ uptake regulation protein